MYTVAQPNKSLRGTPNVDFGMESDPPLDAPLASNTMSTPRQTR